MGHHIIEINGTSTVAMDHDDIVHLLSCTVGDVSDITINKILILYLPSNWLNQEIFFSFLSIATFEDNARPDVQVIDWSNSASISLKIL